MSKQLEDKDNSKSIFSAIKRSQFGRTYTESVSLVKKQNIIILCLALSQLITIYLLTGQKVTQIVHPPSFTESISMKGNQVSESYQTGWALYVAELIGNLNEDRLGLIIQIVKKMIPAQSWDDVESGLYESLARLESRRIEERFFATDATIDPNTKIVWVFGEKEVTELRTGLKETLKWTYEIKIGAHLGSPKILHLSQYEGAPKNPRRRAAEIDKLHKADAENEEIKNQ